MGYSSNGDPMRVENFTRIISKNVIRARHRLENLAELCYLSVIIKNDFIIIQIIECFFS